MYGSTIIELYTGRMNERDRYSWHRTDCVHTTQVHTHTLTYTHTHAVWQLPPRYVCDVKLGRWVCVLHTWIYIISLFIKFMRWKGLILIIISIIIIIIIIVIGSGLSYCNKRLIKSITIQSGQLRTQAGTRKHICTHARTQSLDHTFQSDNRVTGSEPGNRYKWVRRV